MRTSIIETGSLILLVVAVITPAFEEKKRPLNHMSHRKFSEKKEFLKEFHQL
jgi:hypothetical protein